MYRIVLNETSYYGAGCRSVIADEIRKRGFKKVLLVTDKDLIRFGVAAKIEEVLRGADIPYEIYSQIKANPTIRNVQQGVEAFKASGADCMVALGGGSSIDTAKAVGIIVNNPGFADVRSLEGVADTKHRAVPTFAVPTTAGTAAEVTINYVITDEENRKKMVCVDPNDIPMCAVIDCELMMSMPRGLTAATGMDALTHAIEAYVSTNTTPMTDACAEQSIRLVAKYLRKAVANGKDMEAREGMAYAQYLAGMAFNNAGLGYVHAMAHQLGGFYSLPHGECNAILLPHVESFNLISRLDRFVRIAQMMGECTDGLSERAAAELAISAIKTLSKDVGIPTTITELAARYVKAIDPRDIPAMVGHAQKDTCAATNPRTMSLEIISQLYKDVF